MPLRSFSIAAASPKPLMVILAPSAASARAMARTMPRAVFPAPDHDHQRCASAAIAHAEAYCAARAQRLTPIRRQVLEALLASHKPLGAYEIIDHLAGDTRPGPITVS